MTWVVVDLGRWSRWFHALVAAMTLAAGPVCAHQREFHDSFILEHPVVASVVGLSTYNPASSGAGSSPQLTLGLRYVKPDTVNKRLDSTGYQVSGSVLSTRTEDIYSFHAEVLQFFARTKAFVFDHHFFGTAGVGSSLVHPRGHVDLLLPAIFAGGGIQSRIRDWHLETSIKFIAGPRRGVYDISGTVTQVSAIYHFDS